jgi:carbon storage regulator CsrA
MLVLSRKINEKIIITGSMKKDDVIEIVVSDVKGERVSVGINAPETITIVREEIRERKNADDIR